MPTPAHAGAVGVLEREGQVGGYARGLKVSWAMCCGELRIESKVSYGRFRWVGCDVNEMWVRRG